MARNGETTFKLVEAKDFQRQLTAPQQLGVARLLRESVQADFPERPDAEIAEFCGYVDGMRHNPNTRVGGPLLRPKQAYRNAQHVLAIRGDEVVAHLPVADNASSNRPGILGAAEIQGKLHFKDAFGKDWLGHRYLWLGYAAIGPQLRQELPDEPSNVATDLDVMLALGGMRHEERQPVSTYPWIQEDHWTAALASVGMEPETGYSEPVYAFGPNAAPATQEHWQIQTNEQMWRNIMNKEGGEAAVDQAIHQLGQSY